MTDPIADMLTRIRNANQNRAASCVIPVSKVKVEIAVRAAIHGWFLHISVL